jgi:hypothetical protein
MAEPDALMGIVRGPKTSLEDFASISSYPRQ